MKIVENMFLFFIFFKISFEILLEYEFKVQLQNRLWLLIFYILENVALHSLFFDFFCRDSMFILFGTQGVGNWYFAEPFCPYIF